MEAPRLTQFMGYTALTSGPNERPVWGHFIADYMDQCQERFEEWWKECAFPYVVVNSAGRRRATFEDEEHALEYAKTLVGGYVLHMEEGVDSSDPGMKYTVPAQWNG